MEKCKICGSKLDKKQFGVHLKGSHKITSKEYYDSYLKTDNSEGICEVCGNPTTFLGPFSGYRNCCSLKCSNNSRRVKKLKAQTWIKNYGEVNPFRFGSKRYIERINELYGVDNVFQAEAIREKIKQTNLDRYGVENPAYLEKTKLNSHTEEANRKRIETKRKNGTFNTSKAEEDFYTFLLKIFKKDDVFREYNKDVRYPFNCDFYIKSLDLFIELNLYPTHNGHNFNENNNEDIIELNKLIQQNTKFANEIIKTWTKYDVKKYKTATNNNLNYIQIWTYKELEQYKEYLYERYGK